MKNINVKTKKPCTIYSVMLMFFKPHVLWDWFDFGFMLKVNKQNNIGKYHFAIDIQLLWLNLWIECWLKN